MSIDEHVYRTAMARLPTGVTVLTTLGDGRHEVMTANAVVSVSLRPTLLLVSVGATKRWLRAARRCGRFAVNVLGAQHQELARWCADHARHDRPEPPTGHRTTIAPATGLLLFEDALVVVECRVHAEHPAGDHVIMLGEVTAIDVRDATAEPLVFVDRGYATVRT
jgi:flavin reductase (DIM6/NTAB) family NADH-FMN oxidoreductase RutF